MPSLATACQDFPLKIALIGASGNVGQYVLRELLDRDHQVSAIVRREGTIEARAGLTVHAADASDPNQIVPLLTGRDAVISSVQFAQLDPALILAAVRRAGVPRYLLVGGAGTLKSPSGELIMDLPSFPPAWRPEPLAALDVLERLRTEQLIDWTFLSPSAELAPGERTGIFRLGSDDLLVDAKGRSWISTQDYAVALIDELEAPTHSRQRFTVGY